MALRSDAATVELIVLRARTCGSSDEAEDEGRAGIFGEEQRAEAATRPRLHIDTRPDICERYHLV